MAQLSRWLGPLGDVIARAPVPVLAAAGLTAALYASVHMDLARDNEIALIYLAVAAFFGSVAGQAVAGSVGAIIAAAFGAGVSYWYVPLMIERMNWSFALLAAAMVAPLVGGPQSPQEAWRRHIRQLAAAGLALFGASIIAGGVYLAEVSVESLFRLNIADFTERFVLPAAIGFIAPLVFLAIGPRRHEAPDDRISEALGLVAQTFARLVLVPLLVMYAAVLAAYAARVIVLQAFPSGEIGWIVPLFATTGAATFMALGAQAEPGWISRTFMRVWFVLTLPAVALYGVALGIRIDAYGITPARYGAILAGVWFLAIALGFVLGGRRSDIRLIPVTGTLILLLGAIGPWSMVPVVTRSQIDQLNAVFEPGEVATKLRAVVPAERAEICSHVRTLDRIEGLGRVQADLSVGEPGLAALCLEPYGSTDPTIKVNIDSDRDVLTLDDGRKIWGPLRLYPEMDNLSAQSEPYSLALVETTMVVTLGDVRRTFDLAAAARAWQADPTEGDLRLRADRVSVVVRSLNMLLPADGPMLRFGTVFVIAEPEPDEATPRDDAGADITADQ